MSALSVASAALAGITAAREEAEADLQAFESEHSTTLARHIELRRALESVKNAEKTIGQTVTDLQFDIDWHKQNSRYQTAEVI